MAQAVAAPNTLATAQPSSDSIPVGPEDAVWGSPTAPVTLIMFTDFECPYCARVTSTLAELQRHYGFEQLRIVYKHHPLPFHPGALPAARAAQAVFEIAGAEAFFAYAESLFQNQRSLYDSTLAGLAREVGLDHDTFARHYAGASAARKVAADIALAERLGESGTPAFRINGARVLGAQPYSEFAGVIDAELAQASALRDQGRTPAEIYALRVASNLAAEPVRTAKRPSSEPAETYQVVPIEGSPTLGAADALVTIVEFTEYQCPFCKHAAPTLEQLRKHYGRELRLVFKHNPLPFHEHAENAAILALEARKQRGDAAFWQTSARLFERSPELDESSLLALAAELKLNVDRARAAIRERRYGQEIAADQALAAKLGASGTPTFYINGRELVGAQPFETFVAVVDAELAKARALVSAGTPRKRVYAAILENIERSRR
jgi:protein-disulfide isomerase